jgi:methylated-DNA-[protein]-cysteine S-methyltransferase
MPHAGNTAEPSSDRPIAAWSVIASPFGPLHLAATERGLCALELRSTDEALVARLRRRLGGPIVPAERGTRAQRAVLDTARAQLGEYVAGTRRDFDLPLDLAACSPWDWAVLEAVRAIPCGETASYGEVARRIGRRGAARAVGGAVGRNPVGLVIPCHRVIAGDGTLGGYGGGWFGEREEMLTLKRALLAHEGVTVRAAAG